MTTRRLRLPGPLPPRGRSGRFGLPPLAICLLSVKPCECRIDLDGPPQSPRERPLLLRPLEADESPAGVRAAARRLAGLDELAVLGREAQQLALRRVPAAANAAPDGIRHYASSRVPPSSLGSTGIPAGTSCSGATPACGETAGSSGSVSAGFVTGGVESGISCSLTSSSGSDGPTDSA